MEASRRDELIQLCQELIRHPSPSGEEGDIARFVRSVMISLGYDDVYVDGYGSVVGTIELGGPGPTLLMEAQMDHAEVGDVGEWHNYPFGGRLDRGRIYGRGATDQKGILAAMVMALAWLKQDRSDGLHGKAVMAAMVHQETFERAASKLVADNIRPDGVISGEPSELTIERGQRGRASIVLETLGRMEHSSMGDRSSAEVLVRLISEIKDKFKPKEDPFFGKGALTLTGLHSYPLDARTTLPVRCRATFDRRILPGESRDGVLDEISSILGGIHGSFPGWEFSLAIDRGDGHCYTGAMIGSEGFAPAWQIDRDHPFIRTVMDGISDSGLRPVLSERSGFGTNGCIYGGEMEVPTVVFGPSRRELAHVVDEYIDVDQLIMGCECYRFIAKKILTRRESVRDGEGD